MQVGSDISNRNGLGVIADDVHRLGGNLKKWGWSDEHCKGVCIKGPPDPTKFIQFNQELVASSGGLLPAVDKLKMHYFAISSNHTVWFLKCLASATASDQSKLCVDGHLSLAKVQATDPLFAKRASGGMKWKVLDWRVREHYPQLVELLIEAFNGPGEINRRKTVWEVMKQIHTQSVKSERLTGHPDWELVRKVVARTRPPCMHILNELTAYVVTCSGGSGGEFLNELLDLAKSCKLGDLPRNIPAKFWKALADSAHMNGDPMFRLKNMVLLTNLTAEESTVEDTMCNFLSPADVGIFGALKACTQQRVQACRSLLDSGFELVDACVAAGFQGLKKQNPSQIKVQFACRIVRFMLSETKKRQRPKETYTAESGIGFDLLRALRDACSKTDALAGEARLRTWVEAKEKAGGGSASQSATQVSLAGVAADGKSADLATLLLKQGYQLGDHVKHKTGDDLWSIDSILKGNDGEQKLVLQDMEHKDVKLPLSLQKFLASFAHPPSGYENKLVHDDAEWKERNPRTCRSGVEGLVLSDVRVALEVAARLHTDADMPVQPTLNLKNAFAEVKAAKPAKAGAIVLVPWSDNVKIAYPGTEAYTAVGPWQATYQLGSPLTQLKEKEQEARIWIEGRVCQEKALEDEQKKEQVETQQKGKAEEQKKNKGKTALFWRVGNVGKDKSDQVNMVLAHITIDTLGTIVEQGKPIGAKHAKKPDFEVSARTVRITIPVLVNSRDVLKDEVLKYLREERPKEDKKPRAINTTTLLRNLSAPPASSASGEPPAKRMKQ